MTQVVPPFAPARCSPLPAASRGLRPHPGRLVAALGVLGLAFGCAGGGAVFGILAWAVGRNALREIESGRMDPAGRTMIRAGIACGQLGVILALIVVGVWTLWALPIGGA